MRNTESTFRASSRRDAVYAPESRVHRVPARRGNPVCASESENTWNGTAKIGTAQLPLAADTGPRCGPPLKRLARRDAWRRASA